VEFPHDAVSFLRTEVENLEGIHKAFGRRLRPTDPTSSAGVVAADWIPRESEMGQHEPVVATYLFVIESFIKHANEEEGGAQSTALAKAIRNMLYRDSGFRVRLTQPPVVTSERVQRWGVRQQRFQANELTGQFLFLCVTEVWIEVETTALY
jgi:hypothetical protein